MHDIGGLIWVVAIIVAVISSISKSARRARRAASGSQPPSSSTTPQRDDRAMRRGQRVAQRAFAVPGPLAGSPQPAEPARAQERVTARAAMPVASAVEQRRVRTGGLWGIFEDKRALVRAVVASEVLGPPKALQEQSIWSQPHSESSI
jgi:hypothetical protein